MVEIGGKEALVAGCAAQRLAVAGEAGDPHRHAGVLQRSWPEAHAVDRVVLTPVAHRRTRPGSHQDLQGLVEHPRAAQVVELLTGDRELAAEAVAAKADAE